ncbi:hypothetical protein VP01_3164g6 [Puccinia sorghi]|uniref:Uncharacterized protein n=1 Tax=Puccinia sorghi TaxID=27349 RepID=A0A0L6UZL2_9BASI|nr:hypothetical protein VP01_3164g6 [Puccinia sorghi]
MQELANPLVRHHLNSYPHETYGKDVFSSYQRKHFYIYEPVQLRRANHPIVVPIFFYSHQDKYAKFPENIDYHSSMLEDILVSEFGWSYSEVILSDGVIQRST